MEKAAAVVSLSTRVKHLGYRLEATETDGTVLRASSSKFVSSVLLVLLGIVLARQLGTLVKLIYAAASGAELSIGALSILTMLIVGCVGAVAIFKGLERFISHLNFRVTVQNKQVNWQVRENFGLQKFSTNTAREFELLVKHETAALTLLEESGERHMILQEDECNAYSLENLRALTAHLNGAIHARPTD